MKTDSLKAELASYTNSKDFEKYACKQCNKHVRANVISLGICCKSPFCSDATCEAVWGLYKWENKLEIGFCLSAWHETFFQ